MTRRKKEILLIKVFQEVCFFMVDLRDGLILGRFTQLVRAAVVFCRANGSFIVTVYIEACKIRKYSGM